MDGGNLPEHYVYRVYNRSNELIYVGETDNVRRRMWQHSRNSPWFRHYDHEEIIPYPDAASAKAAEKAMITTDGPLFNKRIGGRKKDWDGANHYRPSGTLPPTWNLTRRQAQKYRKQHNYRVF